MPMWGTVADKASSPIRARTGKRKTALGNVSQEQGGLEAGPQAAYLEQNRNLTGVYNGEARLREMRGRAGAQ